MNKKVLIFVWCFSIIISSAGGWLLRDYTLKDYGEFETVSNEDNYLQLDQQFKSNPRITDRTALAIGNAIIKQVTSDDFINETQYHVLNLEDHDVFIVYRSQENFLGGDVSVVINKSDGRIIAVYPGE
ncbi:MAG: hypothetical protein ACM3PP_02865 [Candidatus Saccharibacteria bacterium]